MGVPGLTTFIAKNADKYLKLYYLHDTYLVIDGNNLAAQLYTWHCRCNDCFGGDYDNYAKTVTHFFKLLKECNVTPLIIFDGGYETRKLRTIFSRIRNRVKQIARLNAATEGSMTVFPLFLREVFIDVILKLQLKAVKCIKEADYEMACLARKLQCPLLSYDSDFYIFDVLYIPFSTFTMRSSRIEDNKTIECRIYKIENFLRSFGDLKSECIPLLGVLLGNDYIRASVFNKFYEHIKLPKRKKGSESDQQRRIAAIIKWLQVETYESAVRKILGRLKMEDRKYVANQIKIIADGYICSESKLMQYLDVTADTKDKAYNSLFKFDLKELLSEVETEIEDGDSDISSGSSESIDSCDFDKSPAEYYELPNSFEENYIKCLYPAYFIDMIHNGKYFFVPQIENYSKDSSHVISFNIVAAVYKILPCINRRNLTYILRRNADSLKSFELKPSSKQVPEFNQLSALTTEESQKLLFDILDINMDIINIVNDFPISWRLYIVSVIFWIQNVNSDISTCHIYSIIFSAIALKIAENYLLKNQNKFLKKFNKDIELAKRMKVSTNAGLDLKCILEEVTKYDCIMFLREIILSFQMDQKLRKNPKLFNVEVVHAFAELQSCSYHIKYLNTLINNPFQGYLISDFYNGTLIYNLCVNFMNRPNLDGYVNSLLKYCPNISACFKIIVDLLTPIFCNNITKKVVAKKKKKKTNGGNIFIENSREASQDEDSLYDANNRFSLLKLLKE